MMIANQMVSKAKVIKTIKVTSLFDWFKNDVDTRSVILHLLLFRQNGRIVLLENKTDIMRTTKVVEVCV